MIERISYQKMAAGALALAGGYGAGAEIALLSSNSTVLGDILFLPGIYLLYRAYMQCFTYKETKAFYWFTAGLSAVFSIMLIWGGILDKELRLTNQKICTGVCLVAAFYPILVRITRWLDQGHGVKTAGKTDKDKKIVCICFLAVLFFWILAYLAMFPGVLGTDAAYWYYEFSTERVPVSSQWSPFYCAAFYGLVKCGEFLFGNYQAGFAVLSFVQMLFVLVAVWKILQFLASKCSHMAVVFSALFFVLIPTHVILAVSSAQDSVFAACFAMCLLCLLEWAEDADVYLGKKQNLIKLVFWLVLLCMVRNNGFYAVLIMGLFIAIFVRKNRKGIMLVIGAVIVIISIYQGPVYQILGIEKGTAVREMLSFPLQQMAYVYNYGNDKLSEKNTEKMLTYMSKEGWNSYDPCIADAIKNSLRTDVVKQDLAGFIKLYTDVFLSAPGCCVTAAGLQTFGLWYPNKSYPDKRIWHPYIEYLCLDTTGFGLTDFAVSRTSLFPLYDKLLGILYGETENYPEDYVLGYGGNLSMVFSAIPIVGIFSKSGVYFWLLLYLLLYAVYKKWRRRFAVIGMGIGIFLTVLLCPVMMYRYCAPVIFSSPLFVALFFIPEKN